MKIVINSCFGGFSISQECAELMAQNGCERAKAELASDDNFWGYGYVDGMEGGYDRTSPFLIDAVEKLGSKASGQCAKLKVIEIPDGIQWEIDDYDGLEKVIESSRIWR